MANLTTLENVKLILRIEQNGDDSKLLSLIHSESTFIERYCRRIFTQTNYIERFNGNNSKFYFLNNSPIQSISEVLVSGVSKEVIAINKNQVLINGNFERGILNCSVSYIAGYDTIPSDIEQACIELVGMKYKQLENINISSISNGQMGTTKYIVGEMPDFVKVVLDQYKRVY